MSRPWISNREWLEADGLGGFASGTVSGIRTRRYHALLLAASAPPAGRFVLVNGCEAWIDRGGRMSALSSHLYAPYVVHPDGASRIERFEAEPWPCWIYRLEDGMRIRHEIYTPNAAPAVVLTWRLEDPADGARLTVRPLISGRDPHALHRENPAFRFDADAMDEGELRWTPYDGVPGIRARFNGKYSHRPDWYRNFLYDEERARGLDCTEDLASPGVLEFNLSEGEAHLILAAEGEPLDFFLASTRERLDAPALRASELKRRAGFTSRIFRSADAYLVRRQQGKTIVAGYPWFGDWGRDTFIALRGLCLAVGRLEEAGQILTGWSGAVSEGMLPNRFPDQGDVPEYNSVDASLWYVVAVHEYFETAKRKRRIVPVAIRTALRDAVGAILDTYQKGTRYGIHLDEDGLLAAGEPGVQLTWMDAKVGDWVVTPRIGKPVEVQALWINALAAAGAWSSRWREVLDRGRRAFLARFWNEKGGYLYDVVDVNHVRGRVDPSFRPNQIFAAGGLPWNVIEGNAALRMVDAVERRLVTPLGLRSLAPGEDGYAPRYEGGVLQRDGSYHQGTVWPWLMGPFVEAWVGVRGGGDAVKAEARERFLKPLLTHLGEAGLGHISEIADAEPPFTPRGCPFQAWSVGELLRLDQAILASGSASAIPARVSSRARSRAPGRAGRRSR